MTQRFTCPKEASALFTLKLEFPCPRQSSLQGLGISGSKFAQCHGIVGAGGGLLGRKEKGQKRKKKERQARHESNDGPGALQAPALPLSYRTQELHVSRRLDAVY